MEFFGRYLVARGLWGGRERRAFRDNVSQRYSSKRTGLRERQPQGTRTPAAVAVIKDLILNCGLSNKEIRELRISQISDGGIDLGPGRLLRFGTSTHCVSKQALEAWLGEAKPKDYLFYRRVPPDLRMPADRLWVINMAKRAGIPTQRSVSLRMKHFKDDFFDAIFAPEIAASFPVFPQS
jgi:hypothetical protein